MENLPLRFPTSFPDIDSEIEFFQRKEHYFFVPEDNEFMQAAKMAAINHSLTSLFPIGIVAVKDGMVVVEAGNGNGYHEKNLETPGHRKGCVRRHLNDEKEKEGLPKFKSGEGYELCPGCHTDSHAEANLIRNAKEKGVYEKLVGSDAYMYGHFWCCKECFEKMSAAGIKKVYLSDDCEKTKNKEEVSRWAEEVRKAKENI
jgi:deoxycytidylate deaminase